MTDRELEQRLKAAVEAHTPDVLERVLSDCGREKGQKVVTMKPKKRYGYFRLAAVAAAIVLVLGLGVLGASRMSAGGVASIVMLDVNPSIELKLNGEREVLEANALNEDAAAVLEGMKLKGTDVNTAANAIIGSLLKHGYIDELANSILLSVEDADSARGEQLRAELTEEIDALLKAVSVNAAILAQYVAEDVEQVSQEYQISHGKAALIGKIGEANPAYPVAELAELSVHELNLILSNPKNAVEEVSATGTASQNAYVGGERALSAALSHAGLTQQAVRGAEVDFDYENGRLVYEVEFAADGREYEYDIDAVTGEVAHHRSEIDEDALSAPPVSDPEPTVPPVTQQPQQPDRPADSTAEDIGSEEAKAIALRHAGYDESGVSRLRVERERDDGRLEYSVEFRVGAVEYEYEIAASDGRILDYDRDTED